MFLLKHCERLSLFFEIGLCSFAKFCHWFFDHSFSLENFRLTSVSMEVETDAIWLTSSIAFEIAFEIDWWLCKFIWFQAEEIVWHCDFIDWDSMLSEDDASFKRPSAFLWRILVAAIFVASVSAFSCKSACSLCPSLTDWFHWGADFSRRLLIDT